MNDGPIATSDGFGNGAITGPDDDPPSLEAIGDLAPIPIAEFAPSPVQTLAYDAPADPARRAERLAARAAHSKAAAAAGLALALAGVGLASAGVLVNRIYRHQGLMWFAAMWAIVSLIVSVGGYDHDRGKVGLMLGVITLAILAFLDSH